VARAVLKTFCNNDPAKLKSYEVRFRDVVYPGDTLTTSMWKEGEGRVILQAKTQDGRTVIANAAATFSA
jgi:3-hydroxyacyl-CoA dehydrogenase/3a,7a,12a-trihydroxy-5b-cholest-24-enoyl-CoA hydratase